MDLTNKDELIRYLQSHGLYTKHSLGQNFLVDRVALDKIVAAAELRSDDLVLEVGPGLGTMTTELIKYAKKVLGVEIDDNLAKLLASKLSNIKDQCSINGQISSINVQENIKITENCKVKNLIDHWHLKLDHSSIDIYNDDILKINIPALVGDREYKVVANIPYYITSKILRLFLTLKSKPTTIVVLTQKEVAERICATAGDHTVLSLSVQAYGKPEIVDIVKKESFFPAPKVDSAILKISICKTDAQYLQDREFEKSLFRLIKFGFASKRKTLVNNLGSGTGLGKEKILAILSDMEIGEKARAQELSLDQWIKIAEMVYNK
ncbi:MAG: rRNA adenine dimethyltransferase family protein [Candidatus Berkelbacteria bacterium]